MAPALGQLNEGVPNLSHPILSTAGGANRPASSTVPNRGDQVIRATITLSLLPCEGNEGL